MMSAQFSDDQNQSGLFWEITKQGNIGHNGADPGVFAYLLFNPQNNYGQVFMTNISAFEDEAMLRDFKEIWQRLRQVTAY
ncbi:MAG: hypothetical protein HC880_10910 [Bacteroidia bacterium]|nr:hypothetical protein [Bacteroidia bacterium]